jgi:hypothetical protein
LRSLTSALALALAFACSAGVAFARVPSVADLDASARAAGNRMDVARDVGESIFSTAWPVQVSQISANEMDSHLIVGIRLWGVKFHHPLTRRDFVDEIAALVGAAFAAAPKSEEVDVWASVPIDVAKDVVVNGDLAKPTSRTVFSLTVRRGEKPAAIADRAYGNAGVFWDEAWASAAFKKQGT